MLTNSFHCACSAKTLMIDVTLPHPPWATLIVSSLSSVRGGGGGGGGYFKYNDNVAKMFVKILCMSAKKC